MTGTGILCLIIAETIISAVTGLLVTCCGISDPDLGFVAIAASTNVQFNNSFIHSQTREYDWTD